MIAWIMQQIKLGLSNAQIYDLFLADGKEMASSFKTLKRDIRRVRQFLEVYGSVNDAPARQEGTTLLEQETKENNELSIAIRSYDIHDIEGLRKWAKIDDSWKCTNQKIRASQNKSNPWFIVQGSFQPRDREDFTAEEIAVRCQKIVEKYQFSPVKLTDCPPTGDYLLELSFPDVHLGNMNCDNTETIETSSERFNAATADFLQQTQHYPLSEILFTVGSDFFTINADKNETKKGTMQDVNVFYDELYAKGAKLVIDTIYTLRQRSAKVQVVGILGNHDEQAVVWLMICLKHVFENVEGVSIDWSYGQRKYYRFGSTILAFTHKLRKDKKDLPLIIYQELMEKNMLDDGVKWVEIHAGDQHVPAKYELPAETTQHKITQRVLSSLTDNSRWADDNFGRKQIEAQAFLYHREKGLKNCMIFRP